MQVGETPSILIVGAGHCGGRTAQCLRTYGWTGGIDLVGDEPGAPYERPALSKEVLTGARDVATLDLFGTAEMQALQLQRHLARVTAVDAQAQTAQLSNGHALRYSRLLFANGGSPRRLNIAGADLPRVLTLRTKQDAQHLQPYLREGQRIAIIGGGFIGLEVAASARMQGCRVSLVEGAAQLMGRAVPALLAERATALHRASGVDLHLGVSPLHITEGDVGLAVELSNGLTLHVDAVVVGIGIVPGIAVAQAAGAAVGRGILVDRQLRTSLPHIFAAGDVAEFPSHVSGALLRQETWQNAESQAQVAAHNLMGGTQEFAASSWFWSDQYDCQLQVSGEPAAGLHCVVREQQDGDVLLFHTDANNRLVGASGWGVRTRMAKDLKIARTLVERGVCATAEQLTNPQTQLKALLR